MTNRELYEQVKDRIKDYPVDDWYIQFEILIKELNPALLLGFKEDHTRLYRILFDNILDKQLKLLAASKGLDEKIEEINKKIFGNDRVKWLRKPMTVTEWTTFTKRLEGKFDRVTINECRKNFDNLYKKKYKALIDAFWISLKKQLDGTMYTLLEDEVEANGLIEYDEIKELFSEKTIKTQQEEKDLTPQYDEEIKNVEKVDWFNSMMNVLKKIRYKFVEDFEKDVEKNKYDIMGEEPQKIIEQLQSNIRNQLNRKTYLTLFEPERSEILKKEELYDSVTERIKNRPIEQWKEFFVNLLSDGLGKKPEFVKGFLEDFEMRHQIDDIEEGKSFIVVYRDHVAKQLQKESYDPIKKKVLSPSLFKMQNQSNDDYFKYVLEKIKEEDIKYPIESSLGLIFEEFNADELKKKGISIDDVGIYYEKILVPFFKLQLVERHNKKIGEYIFNQESYLDFLVNLEKTATFKTSTIEIIRKFLIKSQKEKKVVATKISPVEDVKELARLIIEEIRLKQENLVYKTRVNQLENANTKLRQDMVEQTSKLQEYFKKLLAKEYQIVELGEKEIEHKKKEEKASKEITELENTNAILNQNILKLNEKEIEYKKEASEKITSLKENILQQNFILGLIESQKQRMNIENKDLVERLRMKEEELQQIKKEYEKYKNKQMNEGSSDQNESSDESWYWGWRAKIDIDANYNYREYPDF